MSLLTAINKKNIIPIAVMLITLLSLLIISQALMDNYEKILDTSFSIAVSSIFLPIVCLVGGLVTKAAVHVLIMRQITRIDSPTWKLWDSYALSQVAKYLPGRVVGVATQSMHLTGNVLSQDVWKVNFVHNIVMHINSVIILTFIFVAYVSGNKYILVMALVGTLATTVFLTLPILTSLFNAIIRCLKPGQGSFDSQVFGIRASIKIVLLLNVDWGLYYIMWYFLAPVEFGVWQVVVFASVYAGAIFVGMLVLFLPSGFLVREASFIWLGSRLGFGVELLVTYSVVSRLISVLGDLMFFALSYLFNFARRFIGYDKLR